MRFKIHKEQLGVLQKAFKDTEHTEIELEIVLDTATEAMLHQQIEARAYHKGYHHGFKEGFYQGKKPEIKYCTCGCGGNNCFTRFCDENCRLFNK